MALFKKKSVVPSADELTRLFITLATELYRDVGPADGSAALTATLEFDSEYRVSHIKNLQVNSVTKVTPFETIERLNKMTKPLKALPEEHRLHVLTISVTNGQIDTQAQYANS